jgi:hypothetical protein
VANAFLFSLDFKENADFAITDFTISASTFIGKAHVIVAWMSEHGIGIHRDIFAAARLRERSSGLLATGAAEYGWCLRAGMGGRSISRLPPNRFGQHPMQKTTTARTALALLSSAVKGLKQTSIGRFPIITELLIEKKSPAPYYLLI